MDRQIYDNKKYESCTYDEAMHVFKDAYYTLPSYDCWRKMDHLKQTHYKKNTSKYIFKRPRAMTWNIGVNIYG